MVPYGVLCSVSSAITMPNDMLVSQSVELYIPGLMCLPPGGNSSNQGDAVRVVPSLFLFSLSSTTNMACWYPKLHELWHMWHIRNAMPLATHACHQGAIVPTRGYCQGGSISTFV